MSVCRTKVADYYHLDGLEDPRLEGELVKDFIAEAKGQIKYRFSVRTYHHILKTARTIADLDESPEIRIPHLAEAVRYRTAERGFLREPGKTEGHIYGRPQY